MESVGHFLQNLKDQDVLCLPFCDKVSHPYDSPFVLHCDRKYTQGQQILMIVAIFNGLPQPFEVLHCSPETTDVEMKHFMKRASIHCRNYLVLQVHSLPFKLQEVIIISSVALFLTSSLYPSIRSNC